MPLGFHQRGRCSVVHKVCATLEVERGKKCQQVVNKRKWIVFVLVTARKAIESDTLLMLKKKMLNIVNLNLS